MFRTLYLKSQVSFAQKANRIIYTVKRWIWIGNHIPEEWYSRSDVKKILGIFGMIGSIISDIIAKALYLSCVLLLPAVIMEKNMGISGDQVVLWILMGMSCLLGAFFYSRVFAGVNESDYLFTSLMHMDPKEHFLTKMFWNHFRESVLFGIFLAIVFLRVYSWSFVSYVAVMLVFISFRGIGEMVRLRLNDHFGIPFEDVNKRAKVFYYFYITVIVILSFAWYPVMFLLHEKLGIAAPMGSIQWLICHPVFVLIVVMAGMYSAWYLGHYRNYMLVARRICGMNSLEGASATRIDLNKTTYKVDEKDVEQGELKSHLYGDKEGYEYMNALFFHRHKKIVYRPICIKAVIAGLLLLGAAGLFLVLRFTMTSVEFIKLSDQIWKEVDRFIPVFVFVMYCASSGRSLTQAMFYNCDISLLKYGYYRTGEAVLLNFRIRLRYMLRAELPMTVTLCAGILLNMVLLGQQKHILLVLSMLLCLCILSVFYSALFLCMYYIFQPYTEGGSQTGVGYKVCSGGIYMVSYLCLQIHTPPTYFVWIVLGVTVSLLIAGYLIAYKVAPRTFRLK